MKINGIEQVNIGTEEEPYWVPDAYVFKNYVAGCDPYDKDNTPSKGRVTFNIVLKKDWEEQKKDIL